MWRNSTANKSCVLLAEQPPTCTKTWPHGTRTGQLCAKWHTYCSAMHLCAPAQRIKWVGAVFLRSLHRIR